MDILREIKLRIFPSSFITLVIGREEFTGTKKEVKMFLRKKKIEYLLEIKQIQLKLYNESKRMIPGKVKEFSDQLKCLYALIDVIDINIIEINEKRKKK